jgi:hypothetical protein
VLYNIGLSCIGISSRLTNTKYIIFWRTKGLLCMRLYIYI